MSVTINLTHANDGKPMTFHTGLVFYFYFSASHQCTHIVSNGGAFAPVKESVDEVARLMNAAKDGQSNQKEPNHGV